jgi:hypothetical protein
MWSNDMFWFLWLISILTQAQQDFVDVEKIWRAFVQFQKGNVQIESKKIKFQDLLNQGQSVTTGPDSYVKLLTRNRCVLVLYGKGQLSHEKASEYWNHGEGHLRSQCQENTSEKIKILDQVVENRGGEFLFFENRLYVVKDGVFVNHVRLTAGQVYQFQNQWDTVKKTKSEFYNDVFKLPVPKESYAHQLNSPIKKVGRRWYLNLATSPPLSQIGHAVEDYSEAGVPANGLRLATNWKMGGGSFIGILGVTKSEKSTFMIEGPTSNPSGPDEYRIIFEATYATLGYRFNHSSFSFYGHLGPAGFSYLLDMESPSGQRFSAISRYFGFIAGVGAEKIFFANNWLALNVNAEILFAKTLKNTGVEPAHDSSNYTGPYPVEGEDGAMNALLFVIYFGPLLQF